MLWQSPRDDTMLPTFPTFKASNRGLTVFQRKYLILGSTDALKRLRTRRFLSLGPL